MSITDELSNIHMHIQLLCFYPCRASTVLWILHSEIWDIRIILLFTVITAFYRLRVTMRPNMLLRSNRHYKFPFTNSLHWNQPGRMNLGEFSVDETTLTQFFFHFTLPFIIAALTIIHLLFLHDTHSNNPTRMSSDMNKIPFHPYCTKISWCLEL